MTEQTSDQILERLVAEAPSRKRHWPYWKRWLVFNLVVYAFSLFLLVKVRANVSKESLLFSLVCLLAFSTSMLASLRISIPGPSKMLWIGFSFVPTLTWMGMIAQRWLNADGQFIDEGLKCALIVLMVGTASFAVFFYWLAKGYLVRPFTTMILFSLANFSIAGFVIETICHGSPIHQALWHFTPAICFSIIFGFVIGKATTIFQNKRGL